MNNFFEEEKAVVEKENWVSVRLDGRIPDDLVKTLL